MTGMQRGFVSALLLLLFIPTSLQAQRANYTPDIGSSAQDFVFNFLSEWSRPNTEALPFIYSKINDPIIFYGKTISRATFMKAQDAFANRWPDRSYNIEPGSEQVDCNQTKSTCTISGIEYWNDVNPALNIVSTGLANFSLTMQFQQNVKNKTPIFLVTAESGSVISSEVDKMIDNADVAAGISTASNFTPMPSNSDDQSHLITNTAIQKAGCIANDGSLQHETCTPVSEIDVTKAFHTRDRTVFLATQADYDKSHDFPPPLNFCFVHGNRTQCQYALGPDDLDRISVTYPTKNSYYPLLHAILFSEGGAGCGGLENVIWAYDPTNNAFNLIWERPFNCHSALRFMTKGPLTGDIIAVDEDVTNRWPWPYGIEVYKFIPPNQLTKILYLVGRAGQGGKYVTGPNDAIDTDMPQILQHLGLSN